VSSSKAGADAERRRRARLSWPVRAYRLGHEPPDDLSAESTPEERLASMWPLALEAWRLAGQPIPDYDRAHIPARLFRPGDPRVDDDEPR
jgi:hypothetical protein